jgi:hypothetical protein
VAPATGAQKIGSNEATRPWKPVEDAGFTVPEPRDTEQRDAIAAVVQPAGRRSAGGPVLLVALAATLILGSGGYLLSRKAPAPAAPAPVVAPPRAAPTSGRIKIISTESGVSLLLDGKPVGEGGPVLEAPAAAGRHVISVSRPGFLPYSNQIMVAAGETTEQVVKLERTPVAPAPAPPPHPTRRATGDRRPAKPVVTGRPPAKPAGPRDRDTTYDPFSR